MVHEYVVNWSGGRIGAGATVLHFDDSIGGPVLQTIADQVRIWFEARKVALPNDVTLTYSPEIRQLSLAGVLQNVEPVTQPLPTVGTYTGAWSNGFGRMVRLNTGQVIGGRRLQGRIFLVPSGGVYESDGNIIPATITADKAAHDFFQEAMIANDTQLVVWSRTKAATAPVISMNTVSRPVGLRTRNDRN